MDMLGCQISFDNPSIVQNFHDVDFQTEEYIAPGDTSSDPLIYFSGFECRRENPMEIWEFPSAFAALSQIPLVVCE
eukprot:3716585-Amphidinium_carterae.1